MTPSRSRGLRLVAPVAALLLLAGLVPAARAQVKLRWSFEKGDVYRYTFTQKTVTKMDAREQTTGLTIDLTWKVVEVLPDGTAEIAQTFDRMRYTMEDPRGSAGFDTDDKGEPEGLIAAAAPVFRALIGPPIRMKLSARGEITDVKVSEELLQAIHSAGPAAAAAGNIGTEEGIKNLTIQTAFILPEEAVDKGKSWSKTVELGLQDAGKLVTTNTYTYDGPAEMDGKTLEAIGLEMVLEFKLNADAPTSVTVEDQSNTGKYYFDNAEGALHGNELNQSMKVAVSFMGRDLVQDVTITSSLRPAAPGSAQPEPTPAKP